MIVHSYRGEISFALFPDLQLHFLYLLQSLSGFSGVCGFPQDLRQISNDPKTGEVTFVWKEMECEQWNGLLLGYEVKVYFDEEVLVETLLKSVTTYVTSPQWKPKISLPKAISVAAINELGVGDHSPPVKISSSG